MIEAFTPPKLEANAYHCPHCRVYAHQLWYSLNRTGIVGAVQGLKFATCTRCNAFSLWLGTDMLYPRTGQVPPPNVDLPDEVKQDYQEAATVLPHSPKAAAALLRLALQRLCKHLGEAGKNIQQDIGELVKKGLPVQIQEAMDVVRIVGNSSVHPGEIRVDDDPELAYAMFGLINVVAENRLTQPRLIREMYAKMPKGARTGVAQRDGTPPPIA